MGTITTAFDYYCYTETDVECPQCGKAFLEVNTTVMLTSCPPQSYYCCPVCGYIMTAHSIEDLKRQIGLKKSFDEANNQAVKADAGKPRLSLVPQQIIYDIAEVREYGVKKYKDPDNWKLVEIERYRDAMFRHMLAYLRNPQGVDEESGIKHLKHLACNVAFLCEMEAEDD